MGPITGMVSARGEVIKNDRETWKKFYKEKIKTQEIIEPIFLLLPAERVGEGDVWETPGKIINLTAPLPDIDYEITNRLEWMEKVGGRLCAIIISEARIEQNLLSGDWERHIRGSERKVELLNLKQEFHHEYTFDIGAGRVIRTISTRIGAQKQLARFRQGEKEWGYEQDIKTSATVRIELLDDRTPADE